MDPIWGNAKLYYNPEEREPIGIQTIEECRDWCSNNDYCGLARWYDQTKGCHVYRFTPMKRNRHETLKSCITIAKWTDSSTRVESKDHCPHNATHQISCTSYQSKFENIQRYCDVWYVKSQSAFYSILFDFEYSP